MDKTAETQGRNYLTGSAKLSSMVYSDRVAETCEACDRGRTCGVSSFFFDGNGVMQKIFLNYDQQIENNKMSPTPPYV